MRLTIVVPTFAAGLVAFAAAACLQSLPPAQAAPPAPPQAQLTLKKPDLTISKVQPTVKLPCPANGLPTIQFMVSVENVGKLGVNPGPANKAVAVKGPTHTTSVDLPYVPAGGVVYVQLTYVPEAGEPSGYPDVPFTFTVNGNHSIIESDYSNNTYHLTPSIPAAICNAVNTPPPGH